jgi:chromosome partitioning protein
MDPQGQLGKALGLDVRRPRRSAIELLVDAVLGDEARSESLDAPASGAELPALPTRIPHLDVVVANKSLALFPGWTGSRHEAGDPTGRLAAGLARNPEVESYDFVLVDAPPSFGALTLNVLRACSEVVVPVPLTYLALDGCAELMRTLDTVRLHYGNPSLRVAMVIPTFYRRTRLAHEVLEKLKARFPKEIAHTVVGMYVKIDEAQSRGLSIFEHAAADRGAKVMAALAEELEARALPEPGGQP